MEEPHTRFTREHIAVQLMAHAALRRLLLLAIILLGVYYLAAVFVASRFVVGSTVLVVILFMFPLLVFWVVIRQMQWSVLATYQLRCPTCRASLAEGRGLFNGPSSYCKACGGLALLPASALKRAATTSEETSRTHPD